MSQKPLMDATGTPIDENNWVATRSFWEMRGDDTTGIARRLIALMDRLVSPNNGDRWILCSSSGLLEHVHNTDPVADQPYQDEHQVERWVANRVCLNTDSDPMEIEYRQGFNLAATVVRGEHEIVLLEGHVGEYDGMSGNSIELEGPDWAGGYLPELAVNHVRAVVESWSPTWAVWGTFKEEVTQRAGPRDMDFGAVTYIAGMDPARLTGILPPTAHAAALHEGVLITIDNGPLDYRYDDTYLVRDAVREARGKLTMPRCEYFD